MAETTHEQASWQKPAGGVLSATAIVLIVGALAWLRRNPDRIQRIFETGNTLGTHEASGLSAADFGRGLGHLELAVLAALLAICARRTKRGPLLAAGLALVSFVVIYVDSVARYTTNIGGRLYVCICDDALISMRYARNFAEGRGLVYNAGEWVDGYTNPLWTALMVVPHALGMHEGIAPLPIVALGGLLLALMAVLSRTVLARGGVEPALQIAVGLAMVFDASLFEFSVQGLETPLLGMAAALVMAGWLTRRRAWVWLGMIVLTLARADGAIIAACLLVWIIIDDRAVSKEPLLVVARRHTGTFALLVGVASALVLWRLAVYGHPAPNTYYLKVYPLAERLPTGLLSYGIRGVAMYGLPVAFVLFTATDDERARRARRMLVPILGVWLYAVYVGGDAFNYMRFVGPVTPLLWTAVAFSAAAGWSRRVHRVNGFVIPLIALVVPVASERGVIGSTWDRSNWIREVVGTAKTLTSNVPENADVATFYAGMPYYAPSRRFVDMLGKTESHIAHENRIHGSVPGHNKYDFAYVYEQRKPAVTFTAMTCDEVDRAIALSPQAVANIAREMPEHAYHAPFDQVLDPQFRQLYYPHRVVLRDGDKPAGHLIGCWFVRQGSEVPIVWQIAHH